MSHALHTLIEADNFHALQLLEYLYPKQVDCIYIDPPYNSRAKDWKYKVCDKKVIQKALIEERVVQACSELLTEEKVKYIADQVYAACKKDGDLLSVKKLKAALKEADSAIENLWVALEKGKSVDMITDRIHKREAEKKELEKQLAIESKKQSGMEYLFVVQRGCQTLCV